MVNDVFLILLSLQLPVYGGGYAAPPEQGYGYGHYAAHPPKQEEEPVNMVCQDLYETVCNTTVVEGVDGSGNRLPVTQCGQQQRQICAEDKCKIVEGEPECYEKTVENVVQVSHIYDNGL